MGSFKELFQKRGFELIAGRKGESSPQDLKEVLHRDLDKVREALRADLKLASESIEFFLPSGWRLRICSGQDSDLSLELTDPQGIDHKFENKVRKIGPVFNIKGEPIKAFVQLEKPAALLFIHHENPPLYARMDDEHIIDSRPIRVVSKN